MTLGHGYLAPSSLISLVFSVLIIRTISTMRGFGLIYSLEVMCPGSARVQMMPRLSLPSQAFLGLIFIKISDANDK